MYGWIWQHLPGPVPVRVVISIVLLLAVVALLFLWVFPWVDAQIEFDNSEVGQPAADRVSGVSNSIPPVRE